MNLHTAAWIMTGIFFLCGILSLGAAIFNWHWFFRSVNVRMLTLGARRGVARIIYALAGMLMVAAACHLYVNEIMHSS